MTLLGIPGIVELRVDLPVESAGISQTAPPVEPYETNPRTFEPTASIHSAMESLENRMERIKSMRTALGQLRLAQQTLDVISEYAHINYFTSDTPKPEETRGHILAQMAVEDAWHEWDRVRAVEEIHDH